jgi:Arc/MetJ-type ribon-helix-helix transcriptional regulator
MKEKKVTVKIPRPIYRKIQVLIEDSGFNSVTDFIVYVLRDLVGSIPEGHANGQPSGQDEERDEFSPGELEALKRKLKKLGYL